jgi:transcriptional antiterminator NusG
VTDQPNHPIDEPSNPAQPTAGELPVDQADTPQARAAGGSDAAPAAIEAEVPAVEAGEVQGMAIEEQADPAAEIVASEPQSAATDEQPPVAEPAPLLVEPPAGELAEPDDPSPAILAVPAHPAAEPPVEASGPKKGKKKPGKKVVEETLPEKPAEPKSEQMDWYILKVQSNREESIRDGLMRRVAIAGLDRFFGDVIVPTEKVTEFKGGKKRVTKRKLYPGYLVVNMEINEDTWFLVRETPGIGDFTGAAGRPSPMLPHEVNRILAKKEEKADEAPKLKIGFHIGDRVKITEGTFENFEGEVSAIDEANGRVTVMINIFGRSTPVELEYWQVETL